jgi:hypothetical protein
MLNAWPPYMDTVLLLQLQTADFWLLKYIASWSVVCWSVTLFSFSCLWLIKILLVSFQVSSRTKTHTRDLTHKIKNKERFWWIVMDGFNFSDKQLGLRQNNSQSGGSSRKKWYPQNLRLLEKAKYICETSCRYLSLRLNRNCPMLLPVRLNHCYKVRYSWSQASSSWPSLEKTLTLVVYSMSSRVLPGKKIQNTLLNYEIFWVHLMADVVFAFSMIL